MLTEQGARTTSTTAPNSHTSDGQQVSPARRHSSDDSRRKTFLPYAGQDPAPEVRTAHSSPEQHQRGPTTVATAENITPEIRLDLKPPELNHQGSDDGRNCSNQPKLTPPTFSITRRLTQPSSYDRPPLFEHHILTATRTPHSTQERGSKSIQTQRQRKRDRLRNVRRWEKRVGE